MRLAICCLLVAACGSARTPERQRDATTIASNVLRADYAGSQACGDCHGEVFATWQHSPMRNMTRDAKTAEIRAPFDGTTLTIGRDSATMEMQGGARYMRVVIGGKAARYRITKVVGGRYREDFVGVDESGIGVERVMPATYVFATRSWRYKGYSVMVKERPGMSTRAVWANECIPCHNTLPLATMLYDELYGPGLPPYQGKLSDRLLPKPLVWSARSRDDAKLAAALRAEIAFLGGEQPPSDDLREVLPAAAVASEVYLDGGKLVELGIGCEACHNGARAHVADPSILPSYAVESDLVHVGPAGDARPTRAQWINRTCAKCHTVLFTRYPWTWEGGERMKNPGGSTTNSGEGRDYQLGGCAKEMACSTCHDPHTEDTPAALAALATPAGNTRCTGCHPALADAAAQQRHSHHAASSAGNACIGCHLPKKNMGLDYALVRYHRIGSPTDRARVSGDRPLECALCHADKSVESIVSTMEQWYRKRIDRAPLRALYGDDLGVNAISATLAKGKPHEQAVAIMTMADARSPGAVARIAPHMAHAYPLVRFYAKAALEALVGEPVPIDVNESATVLRPKIDAWLATQR